MGAELVKRELEAFLKAHSPQACFDNVDDVLVDYIADVLRDLVEDAEDESSFDVEGFSEMISAYVPEFATVQSSGVCVWVFEMVDKNRHINKAGKDRMEKHSTSQCEHETREREEHVIQPLEKEREHTKRNSNSADTSGVLDTQSSSSDDEGEALLQEMFPDVAHEDVTTALRTSGGELEQAIQRLLAVGVKEKESEAKRKGETPATHQCQKMEMCDNKDLKESVLARYAYVDVDDDKVTHRPVVQKQEPKKMVRYRDGQVVSTKGERYTVLTRRDTESEEMKGTYVNLKPLRKYRFH